jgi:hypothetical protein
MTIVKNLLRGPGGITSWDEDGTSFTVTRNAAGVPLTIQSQRGRWVEQPYVFTYDGAGLFTGLTGDVDSVMLATILADASRAPNVPVVGTVAQAAAFPGLVSGGGIVAAASGDATGAFDTAIIQAAIDFVSAAGGGVVKLATACVYQLRAERRIDSDTAWFCLQAKSNVTLDLNGSELQLVSSTCVSGANNYGGHLIYGVAVTHFTVENGILNGNRQNFTQIPFAGGVTVDGLTILDGEVGNGVKVRNGSTHVTVRNNTVKNCIYHGVLAVQNSSSIKVEQNRILSNGYRAFHYNATDAVPVTNSNFCLNYVEGNGASADNSSNSGVFIALGAVFNISCTNNIIKDEKFDAISVTGPSAATVKASKILIANNIISGSSAAITLVQAGSSLSVLGNVMRGNGGTMSNIGIRSSSCKGVIIHGNTIERYGRGISLDTAGTKDVLIQGNNITDCDVSGIYAGTAAMSGISILGNTISDCGVSAGSVNSQAIYLEGTMNGCSILGNVISRTKGNATLLSAFNKGSILGNIYHDNYDGVSGGRGKAIWLLGTSDNVRISNNMSMNQNVVNNITQFEIAATCTNISVTENYSQGTAANQYTAATGATGRAYGNTGGASWPVGFITGSAAL